MPYEEVTTIVQAADVNNGLFDAAWNMGGVLVGAVLGGLGSWAAAKWQADRGTNDENKAAIFSVHHKLRTIETEMGRLAGHLAWANNMRADLGESGTTFEMQEPIRPVHFELDELYRAFRVGQAGLVDSVRMAERNHANVVVMFDGFVSVRAKVLARMEVPPERLGDAVWVQERGREMDAALHFLEGTLNTVVASTDAAVALSRTVANEVEALWMKEFGEELPGGAQAYANGLADIARRADAPA